MTQTLRQQKEKKPKFKKFEFITRTRSREGNHITYYFAFLNAAEAMDNSLPTLVINRTAIAIIKSQSESSS